MITELLVITAGCFVAAVVNAAFATGGIYIILACSTSVLPIAIAVPLQSAFAFTSLAARVKYFWKDIHWPIVSAFTAGCMLGVTAGTAVFFNMPESAISIVLGLLLLVLIWSPPVSFQLPFKHPFLPVGIFHSFLGTVFGVGALLQPSILRTKLNKNQITGTLAACLIAMDVMKVTGYVSMGFDYRQYLPHIVLASIAGVLGTFVGKNVSHLVSESTFRVVFKWLITIVAIRLLLKGSALI